MSDRTSILDQVHAAMSAAGDVAYDWDYAGQKICLLDNNLESFQNADSVEQEPVSRFHERIHPEDLCVRLDAIAALTKDAPFIESEFRLRDPGGEHRWHHERGMGEFDQSGNLIRLRGTLRPINQRKEEHQRVEYCATYDEMTGHFNRNRLREALEQALYYASRYKVEGAFLEIGIDNINVVNQAFGYQVADAVIVAIGHRLDACLRSSDVIGRLGGDRFGVVLSNCFSRELPVAVEKILEAARNTEVDTPAGPIHVTVSVGAVTFPKASSTANDAMTKADIALQNAKRAGRNTWAVYRYSDAQREDHQKNMVIAEQVKQALKEDRLVLSYQPIVDTNTHEAVMHECLLRMIQPNGDVVAAGMFMPVVEELGLIRLIDRRVIELAIQALMDYPEAKLAINVSGLTVMDKAWLRYVVGRLRHQRQVAERIVIEITETAGLEDVEECARFIAALHKLGCKVALDDFGAGYTSFRHLKMLSVDMVKIDGSFVQDLVDSPANLIFIRSLLDLAHNFSLSTVAECVEDMDQAAILKEEGVDLLQGWAFGKPLLEAPWERSTAGGANEAAPPAVEEEAPQRSIAS